VSSSYPPPNATPSKVWVWFPSGGGKATAVFEFPLTNVAGRVVEYVPAGEVEKARAEERARVVAWLRRYPGTILGDVAEAVEAGEHEEVKDG
jgi:hypothetical protein